ncbi:MAG: hypothetical protein HZA90_13940 [Verrucomicrobia bacterium]|nr:hypothetical protein [Verrucomicrobiota bacterium]
MKKTALGFGLALVSAFCILHTVFISGNSYFQANKQHIALGLGCVGLAALVAGQLIILFDRFQRYRRGVGEAREVFPLFSLRFWGAVLLIMAGLTPFLCPLSDLEEMARNSKQVARLSEWLRQTNGREAPEAPPLRLQAIVITPGQAEASTIINNQGLHVGDKIEGAQILAIRRYGVEVKRGDAVELLTIRDWSQVHVSDSKRTPAVQIN